jgi:uncharacterized protein YcfJ
MHIYTPNRIWRTNKSHDEASKGMSMKKLALIGLAMASMLPARAQLFGPESLSGAIWGSFIGGLVGNHRHHGFSGEGAAIGAGVGLVVGSLAGESRRYSYSYSQPYYYSDTSYYPASGYASPYVYVTPNSYCAPGYYYQSSRPNYAIGGTLLGAASGALIGSSDGKAGEGAAIGAGAGLLLGAIAEHAAQKKEAGTRYAPLTTDVQPTTLAPAEPARPQYKITSRPVANSTYYWTSPPKSIPDAPTY